MMNVSEQFQLNKWVTLFYVNPVWQFMKTVKKPNKAVFKVDK